MIRIAAALALAAAGCTTWRPIRSELVPQHHVGEALRAEALAGTGSVLADGRVQYAVDLAHACEQTDEVRLARETTYRLRPTTGTIVAGALAIFALPVGAIVAAVGSIVVGNLIVGTGVVGIVVVGQGMPRRHHPQTRTEVVELADSPTQITASPLDFEGEPCQRHAPIAELGALELTTPWGEHARAPLDGDGVARFAVTWPGDPDPDATWTIASPATGRTTTWTLADRDQQL